MEGLDVPGIVEVLHMEQLFHMKDSLLRQKGGMAFLFQLIILSLFQGGNDAVDLIIFVRGFLRRAGDDQGGPGLIDQDAIHLIDNGIVQVPLDVIFDD